MKRNKLVYHMEGEKHSGYLKVYILKKKIKGVDGIQMRWHQKGNKDEFTWAMKDWEALCIIEALTAALLYKKRLNDIH